LKDGVFGGAGGIVMSMLVFNAFLAVALLARIGPSSSAVSRHEI